MYYLVKQSLLILKMFVTIMIKNRVFTNNHYNIFQFIFRFFQFIFRFFNLFSIFSIFSFIFNLF